MAHIKKASFFALVPPVIESEDDNVLVQRTGTDVAVLVKQTLEAGKWAAAGDVIARASVVVVADGVRVPSHKADAIKEKLRRQDAALPIGNP